MQLDPAFGAVQLTSWLEAVPTDSVPLMVSIPSEHQIKSIQSISSVLTAEPAVDPIVGLSFRLILEELLAPGLGDKGRESLLLLDSALATLQCEGLQINGFCVFSKWR